MLELTQAFDAYVNGGYLPSGLAPAYSAELPGTVASGLTQTIATPTGDLGFGADLSCWDDLAPDYGLVDPQSTTAVLQSNFRRLTTKLGSLKEIGESIEDTCDIRDLSQTAHTARDLRAWEDRIKQCILADERNTAVTCTLADDGAGGCTITLLGSTTYGPYRLVGTLTGTGALTISAIENV